MRQLLLNAIKTLALITLCLLCLSACSEPAQDHSAHTPQPIETADECEVCGMSIHAFAGPKAQAYLQDRPTPVKFCSTRDLFAFLLQPENAHRVEQIFVHDMAHADWQHPHNAGFIDARQAWFVSGHALKGAMGPTLASFKTQQDAEAFRQQHGGRVMRFEDITLEHITHLHAPHRHDSDH